VILEKPPELVQNIGYRVVHDLEALREVLDRVCEAVGCNRIGDELVLRHKKGMGDIGFPGPPDEGDR